MAISVINNGDETKTIRLEYTAASEVIDSQGELAAERLYNLLPGTEQAALGPFANLGLAAKGALVDAAVRRSLRDWASGNIRAQEDVTKQAAVAARIEDEVIPEA